MTAHRSFRIRRDAIKWFPYLLLVLLVGFCVYTFRWDFERIEWSALPMRPDVYLLAVLFAIGSFILRAVRWWVYLRRMEIRIPIGFCVATYVAGFAYTLAPGKLGELLKYRYYQPRGVAFTPVVAAYTVERLTDLAVLVSIAVFFWGVSTQGYGLIVLLAGIVSMILLLLIGRIHSLDSLWPVRALNKGKAIRKIVEHINRGVRSAQKLLTPSSLFLGFGLGCLAWLCECITLYVFSSIFPDVSMSMTVALGIYAVAIVVGAVSFLPGGLGGAEAAMVALLLFNGFSFQESAALTAICRLLTLWGAIAAGWLVVYGLHVIGVNPEAKA